MRVALHTPFVVHEHSGISRYIRGLLHALASVDRETEFVCFWPPRAPWPDTLPPNFTPELFDIAGRHPIQRVLGEQRWIAQAFRRRPFDVLHSPFGYLPPRPPAPTVLTLPDLRAFRYPETFSRLRAAFLRWSMPRSLRRATRTLAMTEATRQEILALVPGVRPERVRTAYPGLDSRWFAPLHEESVADARAHFAVPGRFLLAVGTREPHKNLPRLLEAAALVRNTPGLDDVSVVLVGAQLGLGRADPLEQWIEKLGLAPHTRAPGIVPDADLPALYAAADVLCFPSLYEGFGYPPLEAMAVGTPVVTSNVSCLPEVAGDAAELADPLSPADIADKIRRVLTGDARRAHLIAAGRRRAAQFHWDDHARDVLQAYRAAAAEGKETLPPTRR